MLQQNGAVVLEVEDDEVVERLVGVALRRRVRRPRVSRALERQRRWFCPLAPPPSWLDGPTAAAATASQKPEGRTSPRTQVESVAGDVALVSYPDAPTPDGAPTALSVAAVEGLLREKTPKATAHYVSPAKPFSGPGTATRGEPSSAGGVEPGARVRRVFASRMPASRTRFSSAADAAGRQQQRRMLRAAAEPPREPCHARARQRCARGRGARGPAPSPRAAAARSRARRAAGAEARAQKPRHCAPPRRASGARAARRRRRRWLASRTMCVGCTARVLHSTERFS